jgi:hypothetical protein
MLFNVKCYVCFDLSLVFLLFLHLLVFVVSIRIDLMNVSFFFFFFLKETRRAMYVSLDMVLYCHIGALDRSLTFFFVDLIPPLNSDTTQYNA